MRTAAERLTTSLYGRLETVWRSQNAPLIHFMQPGMSDYEMGRLMQPLEVTLSGEARVWWGQHDGVQPRKDNRMVGTGWPYLSLRQSIAFTNEMRRAYAHRRLTNGEPEWPASWLALTVAGRSVIAIDCAGSQRDASPIYYHDMEDIVDRLVPAAATLGEVVSLWIAALESGAAGYDAEAGRWKYDYERLPRRPGLLERLV